MPALITHHLFGEQSIELLPEGTITADEERLAFLLGNQGPDPFFFRAVTTPARMRAATSLAHRMHDERMTSAFSALRDGVSHLRQEDQGMGRAFALGMLSHYALDRTAHPFVYAQEFALVGANPELADGESEVHAVIESDLDAWMLWRERHGTVETYHPADELARTPRITRVAGALMSHVAWTAFGITLGATEYAGAVDNMELVYRLIEPAGSRRAKLVGTAERLGRPHSLLASLAHRVCRGEECAAANLERHTWRDPFTSEPSSESFADRFQAALMGWPSLAVAFTRGGEELRREVAGLNYSGKPLGASEEAVDPAQE